MKTAPVTKGFARAWRHRCSTRSRAAWKVEANRRYRRWLKIQVRGLLFSEEEDPCINDAKRPRPASERDVL